MAPVLSRNRNDVFPLPLGPTSSTRGGIGGCAALWEAMRRSGIRQRQMAAKMAGAIDAAPDRPARGSGCTSWLLNDPSLLVGSSMELGGSGGRPAARGVGDGSGRERCRTGLGAPAIYKPSENCPRYALTQPAQVSGWLGAGSAWNVGERTIERYIRTAPTRASI